MSCGCNCGCYRTLKRGCGHATYAPLRSHPPRQLPPPPASTLFRGIWCMVRCATLLAPACGLTWMCLTTWLERPLPGLHPCGPAAAGTLPGLCVLSVEGMWLGIMSCVYVGLCSPYMHTDTTCLHVPAGRRDPRRQGHT